MSSASSSERSVMSSNALRRISPAKAVASARNRCKRCRCGVHRGEAVWDGRVGHHRQQLLVGRVEYRELAARQKAGRVSAVDLQPTWGETLHVHDVYSFLIQSIDPGFRFGCEPPGSPWERRTGQSQLVVAWRAELDSSALVRMLRSSLDMLPTRPLAACPIIRSCCRWRSACIDLGDERRRRFA